MAPERTKVRWSVVVACSLLGALLTIFPLAAEKYWDWAGALPSTMTNLGTSFLLASVLFFLERGFLRRVGSAAGEAASRVVNQATSDFRASAEALSSRIQDLEDQVSSGLFEAAERDDLTVRQLITDVSFDGITEAMSQAFDLQAVRGDSVNVLAGESLGGPRLRFAWYLQFPTSFETDVPGPHLELTLDIDHSPGSGDGSPIVNYEWLPKASPSDVGVEFVRHMQRCGLGLMAKSFRWDLAVENLRIAIADSLAARRHDEAAWFTGQLCEMPSPEWAITHDGVFHRAHGLIVPAEDFPERLMRSVRRVEQQGQDWLPSIPDWADDGDWTHVVGRARRYLPPQASVLAMNYPSRRQAITPDILAKLRTQGDL